MNTITNHLNSALEIISNAKLKLSSTIASNASLNGIPLSNDGIQSGNTLPLDTTNGTDGLDVYNDDLTQPEPLGDTVTSDVATAGQPEPADQTNNNPPSEPPQPMVTNGPELSSSTVQAAQSIGQQPGTQINTQTTDDTTSFSIFNDSITITNGSTTEVEEVTSLQSNGDIQISSTTTTQSGLEVSGSTIDSDSAFDTGVTGSINGGILNQTSTTNSGPEAALSTITENGQLANIEDNAGNLPPGVTISETEGTGITGGIGIGAGVQSTVSTNGVADPESSLSPPSTEITANIGIEGNLSGEVVNSEVTTVSRPFDEAGTGNHTENVQTGTQQTITGEIGISGNASISTEFGSGTLENPQTTNLGASGSIQGGIKVEQTTSDTLGADYNLTDDNDQSQQQQQHLDTGIPSVEPGQQFTDTHTVETSQTLAGGNQIQIDQSIQDDGFVTHDDQGSNVTSTSNQAIQSTNTQSTTDVMTSETGNQQQDGSAPDALPSDSEVAFTNTTISTEVNSGLGSGSITYSDDGTADGPMITVEATGADGVTQSTGGLSPAEFADLGNQASVSNPSNGLLSDVDPANIGDGGLGEMGNVMNNHDTQQGINSMVDQHTTNAQNTASDNQLIEQAQQQQEEVVVEEGDDTVTNTSTEIDDDDGEVDESEESESSDSTESSESSASTESSSSEPAGLTEGQTEY